MSENLIKDKKLKRKRLITYILAFILLAVLIGILVAFWLKSDVQKIPEGQFKTIIQQEASYWAYTEYEKDTAHKKALPSTVKQPTEAMYNGHTIDSFTAQAAMGPNTTFITGQLSLNNNTQITYSSEWGRGDWKQFFETNHIGDKSLYPPTSSFLGWMVGGYTVNPTTKAKTPTNPTYTNYSGYSLSQIFTSTLNSGSADMRDNPLKGGGIFSIDRQFVPAWETALIQIVPYVILFGATIGFFVWIFWAQRNGKGGLGGFGGIGKGKARRSSSNVRFTDVAGIKDEKDELVELVDYLKNPTKYSSVGARTPKGILLEGPPGTGKTLLAKAVAGEAGVPFFSISGSEFEEVFVGLGASRIREMFSSAKKNAPCIIFIDEIDAMGSKRTAGEMGFGGNDQTLNQLLVEMDGFETNSGVIIIAATNRAHVLDPALLRPGRFDRQISVALPDFKERKDILKLHARNKNVSSAVDFDILARQTPGFSGAQLENVLNEASILAVRYNKKLITPAIISEAVDRVMGGLAKKSREYTIRDKRIVSYHEAGHALIGLKLPNAASVEKVTIIPRGQAGGYTILTPDEETKFYSKEKMISMIIGFLGGRASEEVIFGADHITTGAHDDFEKATNIARHMATQYGMTDLGLIQFESPTSRALQYQRWYSEETTKKIDQEISKMIATCYQKSLKIIKANLPELDLIAESLRVLEILTSEQIKYIDDNMQLPPEVIKTQADIKAQQAKQAAQAAAKKTKAKQPPADASPTSSNANEADSISIQPSKQKPKAKAPNTVKEDEDSISIQPSRTTKTKQPPQPKEPAQEPKDSDPKK